MNMHGCMSQFRSSGLQEGMVFAGAHADRPTDHDQATSDELPVHLRTYIVMHMHTCRMHAASVCRYVAPCFRRCVRVRAAHKYVRYQSHFAFKLACQHMLRHGAVELCQDRLRTCSTGQPGRRRRQRLRRTVSRICVVVSMCFIARQGPTLRR